MNNMLKILLILLSFSYSAVCVAHGRWIVPSHTVVSGVKATDIALDMSISNDIFHADVAYGGIPLAKLDLGKESKKITEEKKQKIADKKKPLHPLVKVAKSTRLNIVQPNGETTSDSSIINFGRKSVSSFRLTQDGTYRFQVTQDPIFYTTYKDGSGEPGKVFGIDDYAHSKLPIGAVHIEKVKLINRVETYVTRNQATSLNKVGEGIEIAFHGHPNDLFAGESSKVSLLLHGEPLALTNITLTKGGTRYRNKREVKEIKTDAHGQASISWSEPGLYLIESEVETTLTGKEYDKEVYALYITAEVFAE